MKHAAIHISSESGDDYVFLVQGKTLDDMVQSVVKRCAEEPRWWSTINPDEESSTSKQLVCALEAYREEVISNHGG